MPSKDEVARPDHCPVCRGNRIVEILQGLIYERIDPERYVLGGCILEPENWYCRDCSKSFSTEQELKQAEEIAREYEREERLDQISGSVSLWTASF